MTNPAFLPGQRFTSELEPELGLGAIASLDGRTVTVLFPGSDTVRSYAAASAPLRRARFQAGDRVATRNAPAFAVTSVEERDGLLVYHGAGGAVSETELSDRTSFSTPLERLLHGHADPSQHFDLRREALALAHRVRSSPARGFAGGRIDLIPHQLHIAREVTRRWAPRVLLADEVGLGKTIEACLILHQLLVSARIERALILVPEPLLHQWLVELLRRFHLSVHLFDEERCASIEAGHPGINPFLDDSLVLASVELLARSPRRAEQAAAGGWDMLVVDEAHHLAWAPDDVSREYAVVEAVAARAQGLMLLTATPEQLGLAGHFARLRLLDPNRYPDLSGFLAEAESYQKVAALADTLRGTGPLAPAQIALLRTLFADKSPAFAARVAGATAADPETRRGLLADLIDQHGTGRVMFRNTRAHTAGFPERRLHLAPLPPIHDPDLLARLADEALGEESSEEEFDLEGDPRIPWLVRLLVELGEEKVLLIGHSRGTAIAIDQALRQHARLKTALFHEDLPLLQRDRNAAWFADPRGARLLLSSEIGSEGRNFQFVHHLVLFDLPIDPDRLEQRIGRLDRIGQTGVVHIHLPWIQHSAHEVLVGFHHRGLGAFERSLRGGHQLLEIFGDRLRELIAGYCGRPAESLELEALVADARLARDEIEHKLALSRDHLLELSSFKPETAQALVAEIRALEEDATLPALALKLFEHAGVYAEEIAPRTYRLNPDSLISNDFPELAQGETVVTFDRKRALAREDVRFLSFDHPLLLRAIERFLGSDAGATALARRPGTTPSLLLEAIFVLECVAPPALHVDRFLAATPIRVVVDSRLLDLTESLPAEDLASILDDVPGGWLDEASATRNVLPALTEHCRQIAEERSRPIRDSALARARATLASEVDRLRALAKVNRNLRKQEIVLAERELQRVAEHIAAARLRLDAIRLIAS